MIANKKHTFKGMFFVYMLVYHPVTNVCDDDVVVAVVPVDSGDDDSKDYN